MLKTRLLTAAILVGLVIVCVSLSSNPFLTMLLFVVFVLLAGAEFIAMRWHTIDGFAHSEFPRPPMRKEYFGIGAAYAMMLPIDYLAEKRLDLLGGGAYLVFTWIAICLVIGAGFFYRREIDLEIATHKLINALAGFVYIAVPGLTMFKLAQVEIQGAPRGIALYFSLAVILMGDSGAYFAGRLLGKHKLLPRVSPKKTVEGALGGLASSGLTGAALCLYYNLPFSVVLAVVISILAGLAGQIGDLAESAIKRAANCKDSGNLLPGHGGILDRVDALIFGTPVCYFLFLQYL